MNTKKIEIIGIVEKLLNEKKYDEIIRIVNEYFKQHPRDTELRIQFAVFFSDIPIADPLISIKLLEEGLKIDTGNPIALVVLAYIYNLLWSGISEELYNELKRAKTYDDETKGMIELAKSWYHERSNNELYEKYLLSSVQYGNKFVWNYRDLADFYRKKGLIEKCKVYAQKAFENIQNIETMQEIKADTSNKLTTTEEFLNELVKGTHINEAQMDTIYSLLNK